MKLQKSIIAVIALIVFASVANGQAQFRKRYDFNGDGRADIALFSTNISGRSTFYIGNSPNDQLRVLQWGGDLNGLSDRPIAGDFDGDGRGDFAVIRVENPNCAWYILNNQGTSYRRVAFGINDNQAFCETPVPADYDGDGKDDIAVVRRNAANNTFTFYWQRSLDGQLGARVVPYAAAAAECRPSLPGDYNGDGKADFVVRCRTAGNQQYFDITDNAANTAQRVSWGIFSPYLNNGTTYFPEGDVFVPGDYDGDGKTDLAVVRAAPISGGTSRFTWYIRRSSDGALQAQQYGGYDQSAYSDNPTPADYDGDGKTDLSVSRQAGFNIVHYIQNSSTGATRGVPFGYNNLEERRDNALMISTATNRGIYY